MATLTETPEAVALPAPDAVALPAQPVRGRFVAAFVFGLLAILAIASGAVAAFERSYQGRILPGVHVGKVDLTGLSTAQAATRLNAAYGHLSDGELAIVTGGASSTKVPYAEVGRRLDVDAVIADAMAVGRNGSLIERIAGDARTLVTGEQVDLRATVDEHKLRAAIEGVAASLAVQPVDAQVRTTKTGFVMTHATEGRTADVDAAFGEALQALRQPDAPTRVEIALTVHPVAPRVTTDEAVSAIDEANRLAKDITLTDGTTKASISAATIRAWLSFTATADGSLRPFVDRSGPEAALKAFAPKVAKQATEPQFIVKNQRVVGVIPGSDGATLDTPESTRRLFQLLAARSSGNPLTQSIVAIIPVKPKLSDAEAASTAPRMQLISSWTTFFPWGINNNFGANIWIPARDIDGTVLAPGETFDFWKRIGPISFERGFGLGGAIINGRSEPQGAMAGGICSNSTTLFNTALRAGLQMGARKNHYYYINRYPLGLDATVYVSASGSRQTMSFTNDTKAPILIRGYGWRVGTKGYVKYEMYSVPTGRTVSFTKPIVKNVLKAQDTIEYTTTLKPGQRNRLEFPHDGEDVWVTRTVRDANGVVIHTETYYSHYKRITGILQIGIAPS